MRRTKVSSYLESLSIFIFLLAAQLLLAQLPAAAQDSYFCRYYGQRDAHPITYVTPIFQESTLGHLPDRFYAYMQAHYDLNKIQFGNGQCKQISNNAAAQAYTMDLFEKQWAASKTEVIRIAWTDSPGSPTEPSASAPPTAAVAAQSSSAQSGMPYISCSTSGGAGIDTYLTGVFQTPLPVRYLPSGGVLVDQSILDHFYAYLTQKGYKFKPGSNYGCDVKPTEAEAKAAQHKRAYEGGGCSTCGKIVETGWKE
jgi:hypothetical protein